MHGYKNSKVDLNYHYVGLSLVYENLADDYETVDRLEDAIRQCDTAIRYDLTCKRGLVVGYMMGEKMYTKDRMAGDNSGSKPKYLQAYQILKLMKQERQLIILQRAYRRWYDEEIESK